MEKIDIRKLAENSLGNINVYNTAQKNYFKTEKVKLRIGVFFDGTGNNKFNSDTIYYKEKLPIDESTIKNKKKKVNGFVPESGSSYWNSYSNIALLHNLYEVKEKRETDKSSNDLTLQLKFYIEGIGTSHNEEDDMIGSGMGEGKRGVISRVNDACIKIAKNIENLFKDIKKDKRLEIESIKFDVFGFSRGAAAARHFCNEVLKTTREHLDIKHNLDSLPKSLKQYTEKSKEYYPKTEFLVQVVKDNTRVKQNHIIPTREIFSGGLLGKLLKEKNITFPKYEASVEFLGVFDTVISQMLERKGAIDYARNPFKSFLTFLFTPPSLRPIVGGALSKISRIKKVNPSLKNPNIKRILHLVAINEWRENFPITPIGEFNGINAKTVNVYGAHSDVGGAYWDTKEETNILHFFNISYTANNTEKQKLEKQKQLLRNWYINQKLCESNQIKWKTFHRLESQSIHNDRYQYHFEPEEFMGNDSTKVYGNRIYKIVGLHYILESKRPLSNKLSLVYMNVMKHMAVKFGESPFSNPTTKISHFDEYKLPKGDGNDKDLSCYQDIIIKVAEHGWTDKTGKKANNPEVFNNDGTYKVSEKMRNFILGKFVHLSANFNSPLIKGLSHFNAAYANVPLFNNEKEFKHPPYKRDSYTPNLDLYDKS